MCCCCPVYDGNRLLLAAIVTSSLVVSVSIFRVSFQSPSPIASQRSSVAFCRIDVLRSVCFRPIGGLRPTTNRSATLLVHRRTSGRSFRSFITAKRIPPFVKQRNPLDVRNAGSTFVHLSCNCVFISLPNWTPNTIVTFHLCYHFSSGAEKSSRPKTNSFVRPPFGLC